MPRESQLPPLQMSQRDHVSLPAGSVTGDIIDELMSSDGKQLKVVLPPSGRTASLELTGGTGLIKYLVPCGKL